MWGKMDSLVWIELIVFLVVFSKTLSITSDGGVDVNVWFELGGTGFKPGREVVPLCD